MDFLVKDGHGTEKFVLLVLSVAIPMALFDVVADSFENVGVVEVAHFNSVRFVLDVDFAGSDVNCAVLRVETFCGEFVHCVVCVVLCVDRE